MNPDTCMGCTQTVVHNFVSARILSLIQQEKITQFFGAPIIYQMMMGVPEFDTCDLFSVLYYGYGAAPMAAESFTQMIAKFKTDKFFACAGSPKPARVALLCSPNTR